MKRILIAGIGNIFFGDDAFGCEVARELSMRALPENVQVIDFGIRGYDLAYALTGGFDVVIVVDAIQRGEPPGTTSLIEIDPAEVSQLEGTLPTHDMDPLSVMRMSKGMGGIETKLYLVGCEPEVIEHEGSDLGLSATVQNAVPQAVTMIETLVQKLLSTRAGLVPA